MYDFPSPAVAWALSFTRNPPAGFSVSRTVDGGKRWQRKFTGNDGKPFGRGAPIMIRFFNEKRGYVAAGDGQLLRTLDGGVTWKALSLPEPGGRLIAFRDERHGWLLVPIANVQAARLYATDDAGDSWQRIPDAPAGTLLVAFRGTSEAWLASSGPGSPRIYRSIDRGLSWETRDIPVDSMTTATGPWSTVITLLPGEGAIASVFCLCSPPASGFNVASFDGGATWRLLPPVPGWGPRFIAYQDDVNWWAIEKKILYRSSDAGRTWTKAADNLPDWEFQPRAIDAKHAWAQITVMGGYGLATTSDAGLHWTRVTVPPSA
jgi:photosystem II stability/assembly factor-like uncharacterized protein